ncbi:protein Bouncer-like [Periophthalmus magnuspinnatus]|uniref:protein Bouncer-like n=1 Tax=Periophthalmus magnuspinnatus TaxID=409849 RepID=UPI002436972A|nr:protein Bouncer-like [Periophthalmus magnuspinnatus]
MKAQFFWFVAFTMLSALQGEEEEQLEQMMAAAEFEDEDSLECFRCDLGFWDTCYTTKTNCSPTERCYTGRGKAADVLDVKILGCAKAEECNVMTTVELYPNQTIFTMTKHCCDTPFCNSAHTLPRNSLPLCVVVLLLSSWFLNGDSMGLH